jgi:hypothetical protein
MGSLELLAQAGPPNVILPISASQIARIIATSTGLFLQIFVKNFLCAQYWGHTSEILKCHLLGATHCQFSGSLLLFISSWPSFVKRAVEIENPT